MTLYTRITALLLLMGCAMSYAMQTPPRKWGKNIQLGPVQEPNPPARQNRQQGRRSAFTKKRRTYSAQELINVLRSFEDDDLNRWRGTEKDETGTTLLHYACLHEKGASIARELITKYRKERVRALKNNNDETLLHFACKGGNIAAVRLLQVEKGVPLDPENKHLQTPLFCACTAGHADVARFLLGKGANVHHTDKDGATALHWAAYYGHVECISILLEYGADANLFSQVQTSPLHNAALQGHLACVQLLVNEGRAEVNSHTKVDGITPLHNACLQGHTDVARFLLDNGADVNARTDFNITPLINACYNGHDSCVALLLRRKAHVELADQAGYTALHSACKNGNVATIKHLLRAGADPTVANSEGNTPEDLGSEHVKAVIKRHARQKRRLTNHPIKRDAREIAGHLSRRKKLRRTESTASVHGDQSTASDQGSNKEGPLFIDLCSTEDE